MHESFHREFAYLSDLIKNGLYSSSIPDAITMPDYEKLSERIGNMSEMVCLECGREFKRDLDRQKAVCPSRNCKSKNITYVYELEGRSCPKCKQGIFAGTLSGIS